VSDRIATVDYDGDEVVFRLIDEENRGPDGDPLAILIPTGCDYSLCQVSSAKIELENVYFYSGGVKSLSLPTNAGVIEAVSDAARESEVFTLKADE
jgi:hypothetical protein